MCIVKWKDYKQYVKNKKPFCCDLSLCEDIANDFSNTYNVDESFVYVPTCMHLYLHMLLNRSHGKFMSTEKGKGKSDRMYLQI